MKLHELSITPNSKFTRKRKGRGIAAGQGKTAGRGMNGQNSRTGGGVRPGFEGGQNPWFRRLPKRGFNNINNIQYQVVNLADLERVYKNEELVNKESLKEKGLISKLNEPVKILGNGKLTKKLLINVDALSKTALEAITKHGGSIVK